MSTFLRVVAVLAIVAIAIGIGTGIYNAGVSAGLAEAAQQAAASGDPVPLVPYGPGYGPFFAIIFWILGIFLVIGLVRAAFGWGRWGGGPGGPGRHGGWGDRRQRLEELHRELHRSDTPNGERAAGA